MRSLFLLLFASVVLIACGGGDDSTTPDAAASPSDASASPSAGRDSDPGAQAARLKTGTVTTGLDVPWDMVFLPDRSALVTERDGRVRRLTKNLKPVSKPAATVKVAAEGEGGLLGITLDPRFKSNKLVYLYRTTPSGNEVLRYKYSRGRLSGARVVVRGIAGGVVHNGGRIRFGPDRALYITTGETGDPSLSQDPDSLNGKILRVKNPRGGAVRPEIVSSGHRNVQGLDWQPGTDRLYATEFGPDANDEVNLIQAGRNYGWPEAQGDEGPTPSVIDYEDVIAPSGATFVHKRGSKWSGDLLVAALRGNQLRRITFDGTDVKRDQKLYEGRYGRLRQVVEGPDGAIYLLTNNTDGRGAPRKGDDRIVRIVPPKG